MSKLYLMFSLVSILILQAVEDVISNPQPHEEMLKNNNLTKRDGFKSNQQFTDRNYYLYTQNNSLFNLTVLLSDDNVDESNDYFENWSENADTRIVGGYEIDIADHPSYASIFLNDLFLCGGNIISNRHILTAAYCVTVTYVDVNGDIIWEVVQYIMYSFRIGSSFLNKEGTINYATKIHVHPKYFPTVEVTGYRDVAIIVLKDEITFSDKVQPASIHPYIDDAFEQLINQSTKCSVAGWGKTGVISIDKNVDRRLVEVKLDLMNISECDLKYAGTNLKIDHEVQLCTYTRGKALCQGDSGGGLLCPDGLLAVSSWGKGCDLYPGVFSRVDNCLDFINAVLNISSTMFADIFLTLVLISTSLSLIL